MSLIDLVCNAGPEASVFDGLNEHIATTFDAPKPIIEVAAVDGQELQVSGLIEMARRCGSDGRFTLLGYKTQSDYLAFFVVATVLGVFPFRSAEEAPRGEAFVLALLVAASTAAAEAITHWGYDNLTILTVATAILAFAKSCFSFF